MSAEHPARKHYSIIIVLICIITLSSYGGYYYLTEQEKQSIAEQKRIEEDARAQAENERILIQKKQKERDTLFKKYLTDMTQELRAEAKEYKKKRRLLREIILPFNFETPEYAKESYHFFNDDIVPSLENHSDKIMGIFEKYTHMVKNDLGEGNTELTKQFHDAWQNEITKQIEGYINFFVAEQEHIAVHRDLVTFYYTHANLFTVDAETNAITFKRAQDETKRAQLLQAIKKRKAAHKKSRE